jgi:hypothetical protein
MEQRALATPYDPATSARIRIYGNNGQPSGIRIGQDCSSTEEPTPAYGYTLADKLGSTLGQHNNHSIGMPASWRTQHPAWGDSYSEFVIPAGKPSVIKMELVTEQVSCMALARLLVPQAGQDYEAYLMYEGSRCRGTVRLLSNPEDAEPGSEVQTVSCGRR